MLHPELGEDLLGNPKWSANPVGKADVRFIHQFQCQHDSGGIPKMFFQKRKNHLHREIQVECVSTDAE
jgi:hypothetical protein